MTLSSFLSSPSILIIAPADSGQLTKIRQPRTTQAPRIGPKHLEPVSLSFHARESVKLSKQQQCSTRDSTLCLNAKKVLAGCFRKAKQCNPNRAPTRYFIRHESRIASRIELVVGTPSSTPTRHVTNKYV